ncbi:MAG: hypothetical protein EOP51_11440 [Sphingobacteriales bacterium]|nr:MAG: hypothetical protein EOP51_11440 [Sphingobacteriales bacterium]
MDCDSIFDAFSGGGSVSYQAKLNGLKVISNDILKISHKTGEILKVFRGKTTMPADFAGQHAAVLDRNGEILMFNNNQVIGHGIPDTSLASMVTIIKEDSSAKGFKKTWQFSCRLDDKADKSTPTGGNAIELPDGDIMCCVGSTGRLFIVSKNKRVLWNAIRQTRQNNEDWRNTEVYRITFIRNNADLQPFIFH